MPPKKLNPEDDAFEAAIRVGELSELCQDANRPLVTERRNGFTIVRLNRRSPKVTTALVNDLTD
jgi:hypothetical protein